MSRKTKILSLFLYVFLFLFLSARPVSAVIGTGIFDYFTSSLEGIEEFSAFATKLFQGISYLLLITYIALGVSSYLLQWIITTPINLKNSLVLSGWNFTSGLANTFFILIFIIIALGYILKIGTIAQKRILTNLILAALLVNFSLLLVGAVTDIATFFYNTILGSEGPTLLKDTFESLMGGVEGMLVNLAIWLAGFVALYAIPFSAPFAQLTLTMRTIVTGAMLGIFGPTLMTWILTILFGLGVAGIFFLYFFFFTVRMYIIWALAVFAPLAFICFILPQTKKYWDEWLRHLLEWTGLGIILLFWLVLGLKLMKYLIPTGGPIIFPIIGWMQISQHIQYFLFLFVYLVIGIYLQNKFAPMLAATITELGKQVGGAIWGRVIVPGAKALEKTLRRIPIGEKGLEEEIKAKIKKEKRPLTRREKLRLMMGKAISQPLRWAYRYLPPTPIIPEVEASKYVEKVAADFEKRFGKDIDSAIAANTVGGKLVLSPEAKAAFGLYLQRMKGGKGLEKLSDEQLREVVTSLATFHPAKLEDVVKHKPELIDDEKVGEIIQKTMVPKGLEKDEKGIYKDEDVRKLIEIGISEAEAIRKAAFKKAVDAMKVADIENLAISTIENKDFQEMVVRFKDVNFIRRIGEEKGAEYISKLHTKAKELGAEEIAKTNITLLRQSVTNPGFRAIFPPIEGARSIGEIEALRILVTEPLLLEYDKLKKKFEEFKRRLEKMRPEEISPELGKELARAFTETREELIKREKQIKETPELARKWEEIERLRKSS